MVSAADHGDPQLSSTVTVYINVKDVNDNVPTFQVLRVSLYDMVYISSKF